MTDNLSLGGEFRYNFGEEVNSSVLLSTICSLELMKKMKPNLERYLF
jgi:hypothetical protein